MNEDLWKLLYSEAKVEHYHGYTIVTLRDRTDDDYSYVYKKGIWTHAQLRQPSSGNPRLGTEFRTRRDAVIAATTEIDTLNWQT